MSADRGNIEYLVAKVQSMENMLKAANDERLEKFTGLLSSLESTASDLLENSEQGGGAAAIKAMTEAMTGFAEKLAAAIAAMRPPDVNVTPTFNAPQQQPVALSDGSIGKLADAFRDLQINVEAVMPQGSAPTVVFNAPRIAAWELRIPGQYGAADRIMKITPTYKD